MYESRLRAFYHSKRDNKMGRNMKGSVVYTNRSNMFVIKRNLQHTRKEFLAHLKASKAQSIAKVRSMQHQRQELVHSNNQKQMNDIFELRRMDKAIKQHQSNIQNQFVQMQQWDNQARQITKESVSSLVFLNKLQVDPVTEIFCIDSDRCSKCGNVAMFNSVTHMAICKTCYSMWPVLTVTEDTSNDVIVFRNIPKNVTSSGNSDAPDYTYERTPMYKKYLHQFAIDAPPIPAHVMSLLYKQLSTIHLLTSLKCRPTPVSNILRSNNQQKWVGHAIRISKVFNGEPVPLLSKDIIDKLVRRFDVIVKCANMFDGKLPSFEFLTHVFLRAENQNHLAQSFEIHKTSSVLKGSDAKMQKVFAKCESISGKDGLHWNHIPRNS